MPSFPVAIAQCKFLVCLAFGRHCAVHCALSMPSFRSPLRSAFRTCRPGQHNLQIGSAPVLHMQTLRLPLPAPPMISTAWYEFVHHGVVARGDLRPRLRNCMIGGARDRSLWRPRDDTADKSPGKSPRWLNGCSPGLSRAAMPELSVSRFHQRMGGSRPLQADALGPRSPSHAQAPLLHHVFSSVSQRSGRRRSGVEWPVGERALQSRRQGRFGGSVEGEEDDAEGGSKEAKSGVASSTSRMLSTSQPWVL